MNTMFSVKTWSNKRIADLLWCALMGYKPEPVTEETEVVVEGDLDADGLIEASCVEVTKPLKGGEFWVNCPDCRDGWTPIGPCTTCNTKGGWWDDMSTINAFFTTSGDTPVTRDISAIMDEKRSAGGWSDVDQDWVPEYYSASTWSKRVHRAWLAKMVREWNAERAHGEKVAAWISGINRTNDAAQLVNGWKVFWKAYFGHKKAGTLGTWFTPKQISAIRDAFNAKGITSKSIAAKDAEDGRWAGRFNEADSHIHR